MHLKKKNLYRGFITHKVKHFKLFVLFCFNLDAPVWVPNNIMSLILSTMSSFKMTGYSPAEFAVKHSCKAFAVAVNRRKY